MRYRISGPRAALVAASCALLAASAALAAEPTAECQRACGKAATAGHVTASVEVGVPILSNIPYVSRLFKNVGVAQIETCKGGECQQAAAIAPAAPCAVSAGCALTTATHCVEGATCPIDGAPQFCEIRTGPATAHAPLKIIATPMGPICIAPTATVAGTCGTSACTTVAAEKVCGTTCTLASADKTCPAGQCAAPACCDTKVCAAGKCGESCPCPATSECQTTKVSKKACAGCTDCKCAGDDKTTVLWKQIVELSAKAAASEAKAEAEIKAHQSTLEIFEGLAEVTAEKAALEAKVEAQQAQFATMEKMVELAMENAKLKAEVEKISAQAELTGEAMQIALENELLKKRVEELEAEADGPAARTASKPKR
jgi:hypothetical protein